MTHIKDVRRVRASAVRSSPASGDTAADPEHAFLLIGETVTKVAGRTEVLASRRRVDDGQVVVDPLPIQGSASLAALAAAEGLVVLPDDATTVARGTAVMFVSLCGMRGAREECCRTREAMVDPLISRRISSRFDFLQGREKESRAVRSVSPRRP
ncbi:MAG: hypothetical protein QM699_16340 [Amaricoccus sp.]|uniref:hypothetical protein n=1 Tax=Amaricoccus sp. TaxID=1872485 RepID=UPI0039E56EB6